MHDSVNLKVRERVALRKVAIAFGLVGGLGALAWFLPMRGQAAFVGESPSTFAAHLGVLALVSAAIAAFFGYWSGLVSLRFGLVGPTTAAALLGVASVFYPILREGRLVTSRDVLEALYWAFFLAAAVFASGAATARLLAKGGAGVLIEDRPSRSSN